MAIKMAADGILTAEEEAALDEACESFSKREYTQHNSRIRPEGVSVFDWLSSKENAQAFHEGEKVMALLEESDA
ncbi:MAG: hypothetical protein FWC26_01945 [Fibromonadales bacterium]|nr:hypothetical protein [Fibromonadales bacterium]